MSSQNTTDKIITAPNIDVVIPALDEALNIAGVVDALRKTSVRDIIVVDNGSVDDTAAIAREHGARVFSESCRGYGAACLKGLANLQSDCEIVVFIDGDGAEDPSRLPDLVAPIIADEADFVVGSRALGEAQPGSITPQQQVGNAIAARWLRYRFGLAATDLGPFRAIRKSSLDTLNMADLNYGWTVEMQIKAAKNGLRYAEISVPYYKSSGQSKVSGTVRGVFGASYKILGWLAYHDFVLGRRGRGK